MSSTPRKGANPYVGPRPLELGERLYGRDREVTELFYRLSAERVVLLHSPSGAGKSSLVQAGLIPRLRERFDVWRPARVNEELPSGSSSNRHVLSVLRSFEEGIPEEFQKPVEALSELSLSRYVQGRVRRPHAPENKLLIFDQFEEVLTVDPLDTATKKEFFDQLGETLRDPTIWALFVLREDYLAPLDPYARQVPTHLKNRYRMDLLDLDGARKAMVLPAERGGRTFPAADGLLHDLATVKIQQPDGSFREETGNYVEPVQLQVVCRKLWADMDDDDLSIDPEDVEKYGNVNEALAAYYASSVREAAGDVNKPDHVEKERAIRQWFDEKLMTKNDVRGQVLLEERESGDLDNALIQELRGSHLIRAEQRGGATWYELAHDRLIQPIRADNKKWREARLEKWQQRAVLWDKQGRPSGLLLADEDLVNALESASKLTVNTVDEAFLEASREAQEIVDRERAAAEEKRQQADRIRRLGITSTIIAVIAVIAGGFSIWQSFEANAARKKAETNEEKALQAQAQAERNAELARQSRLEAERQKSAAIDSRFREDMARIDARASEEESEQRALKANADRIVAQFDASQELSTEELEALWRIRLADREQAAEIIDSFFVSEAGADRYSNHGFAMRNAILSLTPEEHIESFRQFVETRCQADVLRNAKRALACLSAARALPSPEKRIFASRFLTALATPKAQSGWDSDWEDVRQSLSAIQMTLFDSVEERRLVNDQVSILLADNGLDKDFYFMLAELLDAATLTVEDTSDLIFQILETSFTPGIQPERFQRLTRLASAITVPKNGREAFAARMADTVRNRYDPDAPLAMAHLRTMEGWLPALPLAELERLVDLHCKPGAGIRYHEQLAFFAGSDVGARAMLCLFEDLENIDDRRPVLTRAFGMIGKSREPEVNLLFLEQVVRVISAPWSRDEDLISLMFPLEIPVDTERAVNVFEELIRVARTPEIEDWRFAALLDYLRHFKDLSGAVRGRMESELLKELIDSQQDPGSEVRLSKAQHWKNIRLARLIEKPALLARSLTDDIQVTDVEKIRWLVSYAYDRSYTWSRWFDEDDREEAERALEQAAKWSSTLARGESLLDVIQELFERSFDPRGGASDCSILLRWVERVDSDSDTKRLLYALEEYWRAPRLCGEDYFEALLATAKKMSEGDLRDVAEEAFATLTMPDLYAVSFVELARRGQCLESREGIVRIVADDVDWGGASFSQLLAWRFLKSKVAEAVQACFLDSVDPQLVARSVQFSPNEGKQALLLEAIEKIPRDQFLNLWEALAEDVNLNLALDNSVIVEAIQRRLENVSDAELQEFAETVINDSAENYCSDPRKALHREIAARLAPESDFAERAETLLWDGENAAGRGCVPFLLAEMSGLNGEEKELAAKLFRAVEENPRDKKLASATARFLEDSSSLATNVANGMIQRLADRCDAVIDGEAMRDEEWDEIPWLVFEQALAKAEGEDLGRLIVDFAELSASAAPGAAPFHEFSSLPRGTGLSARLPKASIRTLEKKLVEQAKQDPDLFKSDEKVAFFMDALDDVGRGEVVEVLRKNLTFRVEDYVDVLSAESAHEVAKNWLKYATRFPRGFTVLEAIGPHLETDALDDILWRLFDPTIVQESRWPTVVEAIAKARYGERYLGSLTRRMAALPEPTRSKVVCALLAEKLEKGVDELAVHRFVVEDVLKWPSCEALQVRKIVLGLAKAYGVPAETLGLNGDINRWVFSEWARENGFDVESPPSYQAAESP